MKFTLKSQYKPTGDQPQAIENIVANLQSGLPRQTLLGVTGSGKTFTMANVIERVQKPTLVISHNKTLAAQLYQEFKEFFPENAVHYFVSYYDYYQPEAYIPQTDTYIEKDASVNEFIDRLRHASTQAVLTRSDTIIVASVSCIYGMGNPKEYAAMSLRVQTGETRKRQDILHDITTLQYERNDSERLPGTFSIRGDTLEIISPTGMETTLIEFFGNTIERIDKGARTEARIFPAKHFVTPQEQIQTAIQHIRAELAVRVGELKNIGKLLEAERLEQKTTFDMEMLHTAGYCSGIENYSRHLAFREAGSPPDTLLSYFPHDFLTFIDESHMTIPQIRGMYHGDRARKQTLIEHGFRLPSALDNRPLMFNEFEKRTRQTVYVSATPSAFELNSGPITQQLIRPTGLLDPIIEIRPTKNQIKNLAEEIKKCALIGERVFATTITKRLAEDIADYLKEEGIRAEYMHADVKTLERPALLNKLRRGEFDVLVGINLLREGLDVPEVSLVAILDADKEGFLRNATTLIQTMGRAARHIRGKVIMYADTITGSMREAIQTTEQRRTTQEAYNREHNITPQPIHKEVRDWFNIKTKAELLEEEIKQATTGKRSARELAKELEAEMLEAAEALDFERAAALRDALKKIQ